MSIDRLRNRRAENWYRSLVILVAFLAACAQAPTLTPPPTETPPPPTPTTSPTETPLPPTQIPYYANFKPTPLAKSIIPLLGDEYSAIKNLATEQLFRSDGQQLSKQQLSRIRIRIPGTDHVVLASELPLTPNQTTFLIDPLTGKDYVSPIQGCFTSYCLIALENQPTWPDLRQGFELLAFEIH